MCGDTGFATTCRETGLCAKCAPAFSRRGGQDAAKSNPGDQHAGDRGGYSHEFQGVRRAHDYLQGSGSRYSESMNGHVLIGLMTAHKGDPLCGVIEAETRSQFTHALFVTDRAGNEIYEQFFPHARFRRLGNDELPGLQLFSIDGWSDLQDAKLRQLIAGRAAAKVPYWIEGLLKFGAGFRMILGEGTEGDWSRHAFCSMEVFEDVKVCGTELLRAQCYEVSPAILSFSPLLNPEPPLGAV